MTADAGALAATCFRAWQDRDFGTLRSVLADDDTFRGPLGQAGGGGNCLLGLRGMAQIITKIDIQHVFVAGPDVLTWFDLHTSVAPPCPTANWSHAGEGKINRIRVTFGAREIAAATGRWLS